MSWECLRTRLKKNTLDRKHLHKESKKINRAGKNISSSISINNRENINLQTYD